MSHHMHRLMLSLFMGASVTFVACSGKDGHSPSKVKGDGTFDPKPADPASIEGQLKRFKGQTAFLTPYQSWNRGPLYAAAETRAESRPKEPGGARAIQESDIFKIGPAGSKLLYLLNNYRGLQVVSFADSPDTPKILGRVDATGNWAHDMYFDAAHQRLIVLENVWYDDEADTYDYSDMQSRAVIYDVSTAEAPKIKQIIPIKGQLSESRLVGDVLYVATSVRPSYQQRQSSPTGAGYVQSFDLTQDSVQSVEQVTLSAPVSWGEEMNVVEIKDGQVYKYYVVAILSKDSWGFWDRQSVVQVVDISDAKGKIKPVMVATAKGSISKRSQTTITNNTLVVTSNYLPENSRNMRISVETFRLPGATPEVLGNDEAEFRRLSMERAVAKKKAEWEGHGLSADQIYDAIDAYRAQLMADKELGLQGRFVKDAISPNTLRKLYSDSAVTVGSTQNLSAALQDVRYQDGLLYAFWVPANNIDPLDIFDIRKPEDGVKHLSHLEFDGWIQHAIPTSYQGKNYIMGLGWIIPSINNERNLRYPQAALFEIKRAASGAVRAELVTQQNLQGSRTWANFNAQDKMIEVRFASNAKGTIMYTFSSWEDNQYTDGGKLIAFDLSKVDSEPEKVFSEGGVLKGNDGWLRRMFSNPEIERVNGFADTALSTYNVPASLDSGASAIIKASSILELARNIVGFETLGQGAKARGLQLVSDQTWWTEAGSSELRLVKLDHADAEANQLLSSVKLDGSIVDYARLSDNALVVLSQKYRYIPAINGRQPVYKYFYQASRVALQGDALKIDGQENWEYGTDVGATNAPRFGYLQKILALKDGTVLAAAGGSVKQLSGTAAAFVAKDLVISNCALAEAETAQLQSLSGRLFLSYNQVVNDPAHENVRYQRSLLSQMSVKDGRLLCEPAVNIPGRILQVLGDDHLITDDTRLIDIVKTGEAAHASFQTVTEPSLDSLALVAQGKQASLRDLYDPKNVAMDTMRLLNDHELVFVESTAQPYYGPWGAEPAIWRPSFTSRTDNRLVIVGFDDDYGFTKTAYSLGLKGQTNARVVDVFAGKPEEGALIALSQGRRLSVLAYKGLTRPVARQLQKQDALGQWREAKDYVTLPGGYWSWSSDLGRMKLDQTSRTFLIPQGLNGVATVKIAD